MLSTADLLVLTGLDKLLLIQQTLFTFFNETSYLSEEVNRTEPSPSVSVPWFMLHHNHLHFWSTLVSNIPYFIEYNVHTSIARTSISKWFLVKFLFLFFKNNLKRNNLCKSISHLPSTYSMQGIFQHHFQCALYSIKYSNPSNSVSVPCFPLSI